MTDYSGPFFTGLTNILPLSSSGVDIFLVMLLGIAIGYAVGILPGLGSPVALSLMLPITLDMGPSMAFAFLLSASATTGTTGDITSILFGVPGEATTAATVLDGHPMAKKGEAGRALGAALSSSLVGAIFGAFILAAAFPIVRPLVLSIASPEFFMLALLGVTYVAALSRRNILKGLTVEGFGLVLATVGLDPIDGIPRFTLKPLLGETNSLFLWDGISLVPVVVGLFAIPEIIDLAVKGTGIARRQGGKLGGVMQGVKDTFRHRWLVLRCSAISTYIGIIPGLGNAVSQWVAYAHAVQSSTNKERFGKGAVESVLGPGAANNSGIGGALIPTVAFGVPGGLTTAILLGAFVIQGLVPGPDILDPDKNLALTFSFVWIIVVSNIIVVSVSFLFLNHLAKITYIRGSFLIPFMLLLVYISGFSVKNSFGDLVLVIIFGALGWLMLRYGWQRPPLLLGLVLGRIAERNLFISTNIYGASWLLRPGVLVIGLFISVAFFYPMFRTYRQRRREAEATSWEQPKDPGGGAP